MTVGLVVVSHSHPLARAAVALAAEMASAPVTIEIAAGMDESTFGTDAVAIAAAMTAADSGDGVVVLMDLGSAVLSAELALELLDAAARSRVVLCAGPLVEGLVAATVAAAAGAGRSEVAEEARAGLAGKVAQVGGSAPSGGTSSAPSPGAATPPGGTSSAPTFSPGVAVPSASAGPPTPADLDAASTVSGAPPGREVTVTVADPHGLHARPAARLVTEVRRRDVRVTLRNATTGSAWVPASSLSAVATLGALQGHHLSVRASGPAADAVTARIVALVSSPDVPPSPAAASGASSGIAIGPAVRWRPADVSPVSRAGHSAGSFAGDSAGSLAADSAGSLAKDPAGSLAGDLVSDAAAEEDRLAEALAAVREEIGRFRSPIFDAHLLLLDDLAGLTQDRIASGAAAPPAWTAAVDQLAARFEALSYPYLRGRAADVRALGDQVLRELLGLPAAGPAGSGVLVAPDLTPAQAAALDPARITGVVLAGGSPTSHAAILLKARGIPAVTGAGPAVLSIPDGTLVALDGTGEVAVDPPAALLASFRARAEAAAARNAQSLMRASAPARTRSGTPITVAANIGSLADARAAAANGADEAGLVRTEFLFLDRDTAPTVDDQAAAYRSIAEALGGRRITLRTLDAGSDKPLPYLPAPSEANPALGLRGLRHSLAHPDLLTTQLLAMARVARETPISVMFPMVTTVGELLAARHLLDKALAGSEPPGLRVGMMVEVPAAALHTAEFAPHVDFFSIGTNDLTQYTLATERGNPALAALSHGLHPAVLDLITTVCTNAQSKPVAVCGELAADEQAAPKLIAAGVRELSVAPAFVPLVKEIVRAT
ncbi:phosphoenolpyruvate--protein phosphotransferase [Symbioplanes lichenis]|uniref:phosphoenolpyruvate--protein phosphotransferase n=1 Tax=Symbioplanes lichenis TaxID=1629072 RepID=UPI002739B8FE|nr:phosphoenolpyruvate--protein phosphotransferase [Actinoplanes lichenis]